MGYISEGERSTVKQLWKICHNFQGSIMQDLPHLTQFGRNQGWVGTRRELSSLPRASKREWPEKLRRPWGSNPRPCAPSCSLWLHLQSDSSGLRSSGFWCSAPWYSGWLVGAPWGGRHSYGRGSNPAFLKGISIQTTPAPLLGLQHAANVPG